jgi:hypothetical protein
MINEEKIDRKNYTMKFSLIMFLQSVTNWFNCREFYEQGKARG